MTYKQPINLHLLTAPLGVDKVIQDLQIELGDLSWLEYSFGRAFIGRDKAQAGRDYNYPMVYSGDAQYYDASPNDNIISQSFFVIDGDYNFNDYLINEQNLFRVPVSLIVWGNLKKISDVDEHFGQILLQQVLKVVNENNEFLVQAITDNEEDVFREFTVRLDQSSLFYYPYFCYRIKMEAQVSEECITDIEASLSQYIIS